MIIVLKKYILNIYIIQHTMSIKYIIAYITRVEDF